MTQLNAGNGLEITDSERAYLVEMTALGTDELGREIHPYLSGKIMGVASPATGIKLI
jgi:hypothetical protein